MTRKNSDNQLVTLESVRSHPYFRNFEPRAYPSYDDRKVNPVGYLEEIGIEKIGEFVQFGFTSIQIASALGVSTFVLRKWIQNNPDYQRELEFAKGFAAEEIVQKTSEEIRQASDQFELSKASEHAKHNRWRAERLDRDQFGAERKKDKNDTGVGVTIQFNMPMPDIRRLTTIVEEVNKLPANTVDMKALFASQEAAE